MDADPIVLEPGSPEWLREMTASKVAAVLGLSPWQSPFSLWYEMAGAVEHAGPNKQMERGHYLEDAVARWVADQHSIELAPGRCWRNRARPWQVASPDRLVVADRTTWAGVSAVVEVKTAADWERWGPDGSDEVPPYYRAQAVWQCDTLGVDTCYMGVLLPRLELRSYVLHPAEDEAEFIRERARDFLDSLTAGVPPDVDTHSETYRVLRQMHPHILDEEVELPPDLARAYARAVLALRAAEDEYNLRRSEVARTLGDARWATLRTGPESTMRIANRQAGPKGTPYVNPGTEKRLRLAAEEEL